VFYNKAIRPWFVVLCALGGAPAQAIEFSLASLEGSFDTTLSVGAAMRMSDPDPASIGIANGGAARTVNEDDGNLNYEQGDLYSAAAKATHELQLRRGTLGVFVRGSYFVDWAARDAEFLGPKAQERLGQEGTLLDAYAYGSFSAGARPVAVRLGKQVINWGENTFIPNGISVINPIDVSKLRTPGAELKEALIPSPMVWFSVGLTETLGLEALWITSYDKTRIDPRGSYFSTNDFISDDGDNVYVGFGRRNDQHDPFTAPPDPEAQVWIPRTGSPPVQDDRRQYGAALRYFSSALNDTEFGLYYVKYHSRTPLVSGIRGTASNLASGTGTARYFDEHPGNIEVYGASFNTGGPLGIALQGEYSYRPNQPTQLAAVEVLLAVLGLPNNVTGAGAGTVPAGTVITGYRRVPMHQLQTTLTKAFGPTAGADQFVLLGEIAVNRLELTKGLLFAAPGAQLPAPGSANAAGGSFQQEGYADRTSWGYRVLSRMDFENAIGAAQLSPRIVLFHDVNGVGPNFNQDAKAVSAGVTLSYLQRWQLDLAYTSFFGGRTYTGTDTTAPPPGQSAEWAINANPLADRDFAAISVSYSF
jgi:hypothetical protein